MYLFRNRQLDFLNNEFIVSTCQSFIPNYEHNQKHVTSTIPIRKKHQSSTFLTNMFGKLELYGPPKTLAILLI